VAHDDTPDRELVERALRGDNAAWGAIVDRYGGLAFAMARRAGLGRNDEEDVAQGVFATLVRSLAGLRDTASLAGWVATSARRAAWRAARRSRLDRGSPAAEDAADDDADARDLADAVERRRLVEQALGSIDERCRHLLQALFLGAGDPDYQAIGARFGIAPNSVGPVRNRCLRRMLEALEALGFEPGEHGLSEVNPRIPRTDPSTGAS